MFEWEVWEQLADFSIKLTIAAVVRMRRVTVMMSYSTCTQCEH